ncbi:hypothetical protein ACQP2U_43885 (plasmid) [Nocardia sp. CA-084685]|uniref:hypothetical protein n=1 Tax=Nocardia sp. CA-084685 TaxID=3239970 RepID=UPI003D975CEE
MTSADMRRDVQVPGSLIRLSKGAALVDKHPVTLRRWISQGKLTGWRTSSGQIMVSRDQLLRLTTPVRMDVEVTDGLEGAVA